MRVFYFLFLILTAILLAMPITVIAAEQTKETSQASVECTTNKGNVPTCRKKSGTSAPAVKKRQTCVYKCTKENGIWICRGNGPQCNGQSPWD